MSSQPLKRASAAHAGVGQGSWAAKQALVGCCRLRAGRDKGCLVGVSGQKGVQEKTSQGESLCPQPLSVTTSSVEQIYIKTILEHKKGHKTRLLYREARHLGWDRATGTQLYRSCRWHRLGSRPVSLGGAAIQSMSPSRELGVFAAGAFSLQATRPWRSKVCCVSAQ